MKLFRRLKNIFTAKANKLLDVMEIPEEMIDVHILKARENLQKVRSSVTDVMAEEELAKAELERLINELGNINKLVEKAVSQDDREGARILVSKKLDIGQRLEVQEEVCESLKSNAEEMKTMYNKMVDDVKALETRRDLIKAKSKMSNTQEVVNRFVNNPNGVSGELEQDITDLETKVNRKLSKAKSETTLLKDEGGLESVMDKYNNKSSDVETELDKLFTK